MACILCILYDLTANIKTKTTLVSSKHASNSEKKATVHTVQQILSIPPINRFLISSKYNNKFSFFNQF